MYICISVNVYIYIHMMYHELWWWTMMYVDVLRNIVQYCIVMHHDASFFFVFILWCMVMYTGHISPSLPGTCSISEKPSFFCFAESSASNCNTPTPWDSCWALYPSGTVGLPSICDDLWHGRFILIYTNWILAFKL